MYPWTRRSLLLSVLFADALANPTTSKSHVGVSHPLRAGRVAISPIAWESLNGALERVPRTRSTEATEKLQQKLDQAVEAKDYELASALKREMESDTSAVADEVWRSSTTAHLTDPIGSAAATADNCRDMTRATWNKMVEGEAAARSNELTLVEMMVKQILVRAASLGHWRVSFFAEDTSDHARSRSTWQVHDEMARAAFVFYESKNDRDPIGLFVEKELADPRQHGRGGGFRFKERNIKLEYVTVSKHSNVRPNMMHADFVEHAAATYICPRPDTGGGLLRVQCGDQCTWTQPSYWMLGSNAGLTCTLEALATEWNTAEECVQSAFKLRSGIGDTRVEVIRIADRSQWTHSATEEDEDNYAVPDFLGLDPHLPWDKNVSFFDAHLAAVDEDGLEGVLSAAEHRCASEQLILAGRFLKEHLEFENALPDGAAEELATLLSTDPLGSRILLWRLQRAGFHCTLSNPDRNKHGPSRGLMLAVDLFKPSPSPSLHGTDLAEALAEDQDVVAWPLGFQG